MGSASAKRGWTCRFSPSRSATTGSGSRSDPAVTYAFWFRTAAALMFLSVALGAFAAHGLKEKLDAGALAVFETGVRYQVYHALALFAVAWIVSRAPSRSAQAAGFCFFVGILLF